MRKIAFVFPGQGSQYVGMGQEFYENYSKSREIFRYGDERLGISLSDIIFKGPEDDLKLTVNTQPAILTVSTAILQIVFDEGITPEYVAGHSLGEYSALVAAGSIEYGDAVWLVRKRGEFMQEAVPPGEGTMAAILGLEMDLVEKVCQEASLVGVVEPANYNSPGQLVIAGSTPAVEKAIEISKNLGAKRAMLLPVSGPFHSSLLRPASIRLNEAMKSIKISPPKQPVMANINAKLSTNPDEIRQNLIAQVSGPVLWQQSVENLIKLGINTFVEIGPGKVLTGLIKKIDKTVELYNIEDKTTLMETIARLKGE